MSENTKYRSAFDFALTYAQNTDILNQYINFFKGKGIEHTSKANLQNCMLFAGALLDENMGFNEKKTQEASEARSNVQSDIVFTLDNVKIINKLMLDFSNAMYKKDKKNNVDNKAHYQEVYNVSKAIVQGIFEDEIEERQQNFLNELSK